MSFQFITTKGAQPSTREEEIYGGQLLNSSMSGEFLERTLQMQGQQLLTNDENDESVYTAAGTGRKDFNLVSVLPKFESTSSDDKFIALQKWEGYITSIEQDKVTVRLRDLTHGGTAEEAEFSLEDDINPSDREFAKLGAIFYWSIGHETRNGTRQKTSLIKFKRTPLRDADTIIENRAKSLAPKYKINWE